jgi:hypothetical protein
MNVFVGSALVGSIAIASGVALYRGAKVWRFRRWLRELHQVSRPESTFWIRHLDGDQEITLRKVLERSQVPTEVKIEICEILLEQEKFSRCMKSDYLIRLMLDANPALQTRIAQLALRFAECGRGGIGEILKNLDRVSDPILIEILLTGLALFAAAVPGGGDRRPFNPTEAERSAIAKKTAYMLGNADERVRLIAARLLNSILVGRLVDVEVVFMELLRDSRKEVRHAVAELVLKNRQQLKSAMCCVRGAIRDLAPELRAQV